MAPELCLADAAYDIDALRRLKDFRRIATRYDGIARNDFAAVAIAVIVTYWI